MWVFGCRAGQNVVALDIASCDGGMTLTGQMNYAGEGAISVRATLTQSNTYAVENQWGGETAPWHPGGTWVLGCRGGQNVVAVDIVSSDGGATFTGAMTYSGEGPIGFKSELSDGAVYAAQNRWGGCVAPWHQGGVWVLGCRHRDVVALDIRSGDHGKTFTGSMTYAGEGPIGVRASAIVGNNYAVEHQCGGNAAPWQPGGTWLIGCRAGQHAVAVNVSSADGGNTFHGGMAYHGEGPVGLRASALPA